MLHFPSQELGVFIPPRALLAPSEIPTGGSVAALWMTLMRCGGNSHIVGQG